MADITEKTGNGELAKISKQVTSIELDSHLFNLSSEKLKLKEQLKKVDRQMATQRGNRGQLVRLSLVGYTNVGKSTLMNILSKSDVFAENKLFATLYQNTKRTDRKLSALCCKRSCLH